MGIIANRKSAADYDGDMKAAKAAGIDAFALNIGTDSYAEEQLGYAYESAANNDMKVFISFDFNWFSTGDATKVGAMIKEFGGKPGQLKVDNKAFVSSFVGDGLDVATVRSTAGMDLYLVPNFKAGGDASGIDGAFNWMAWDSNGANRAPSGGTNVTVSQGDDTYKQWLGDKAYMAPVSPWFHTHYGPEVSYSKNWVFPGDLLWYNRWNEILELQPPFVEIITWNDYGESHYVGPLSSPHGDDGNSKWANDMPHNGWLEMAKPFIAAYKAGQKTPAIDEDKLVYWYRPTPKTLDCTATDTIGERPDGYDTMEDSVFVVSLLKTAGSVTATSGSNTQTFDAPAGAAAFSVKMGVGAQTFSLSRDGTEVMKETSLRDVMDTCPCGIYNYNAFVGTVPAGEQDQLQPDSYAMLSNGLKTECQANALPIRASGSVPENPITPSATPEPSSTPVSGTVADTPKVSATSAAAVTSAAPSFDAPPTPKITPTPTATQQAGSGSCTMTVTASSQIAPTNCLASGQAWGGEGATPDCCDGATCCR